MYLLTSENIPDENLLAECNANLIYDELQSLKLQTAYNTCKTYSLENLLHQGFPYLHEPLLGGHIIARCGFSIVNTVEELEYNCLLSREAAITQTWPQVYVIANNLDAAMNDYQTTVNSAESFEDYFDNYHQWLSL